jgi:hypothetical protein
MPAPLPAPHVPPGFPPLATTGSPTTRSSGPTEHGTEAARQTVSPGDQTTLGTEAGGQTVSPRGQTPPVQMLAIRPPPWIVRSTGHAPLLRRLLHDFGCVPRGALDPTHTTRGPAVYD